MKGAAQCDSWVKKKTKCGEWIILLVVQHMLNKNNIPTFASVERFWGTLSYPQE